MGWNFAYKGTGDGTFSAIHNPYAPDPEPFNPGDTMYLRFIVDNTAIDPATYAALGPIQLYAPTPESLGDTYAINTSGFRDNAIMGLEPAP